MIMKTILIEVVSNGWIVRPFQACEDWAITDKAAIAVFRSMSELQAALPNLIDDWTAHIPGNCGTIGGGLSTADPKL